MELHYITLKRQLDFLRPHLVGSLIAASFTQKKNELTLNLQKKGNPFMDLLLSSDARYPYMLLRSPHRRIAASANVLQELINKEISGLSISPVDRIVMISFLEWSHQLILQFFRNNTNFIIIDLSEKIISSFKREKKIRGLYYRVQSNPLLNPLEIDFMQFRYASEENPEFSLTEFLKKKLLFMSRTVIKEIITRSSLPAAMGMKSLNDVERETFYREMKKFLRDCQTDPVRIYLKGMYPEAFALTEMEIFQFFTSIMNNDTNDALSYYIFTRQKLDSIIKKRTAIRNLLDKKLEQLENLLNHLRHLPDEGEQRAYYRKMGELILAQMHGLPQGKSEIYLIDLYDPSQRKIKVNVNPKIPLKDNAATFFNKAREVSHRAKQVRIAITNHEKQQNQLQKLKTIIDEDLSMKDLLRIEKKLIDMKILQTDDERMQEVFRPYRQYFFRNWEIWVGKNARSNDEMTFQFAHKEDVWLHVQGAGGSHVIIRKSNRRSDIPRHILEKAARLAAGNSQAKTSSYVPVMYTLVKYVRKPRGSPPGSVMAERTKTLFVEPERD